MFASTLTSALVFLSVLALGGAAPTEAGPAVSDAAVPVQGAEPEILMALMPIENLSDAPAPLSEMRAALRSELESMGFRLLDDATLERFLDKHRVRYMGGVARELGRALRDETGAQAVLVTSLDLYQEKNPPRIAVTSRLISTGGPLDTGDPAPPDHEEGDGRILWMDGADRSGDELPGFLGLGRLEDMKVPREEVLGRIAGSLARRFGKPAPGPSTTAATIKVPRRFLPRSFYRSPGALPQRKGALRLAVLPFANESTTRHASDILTRHLIHCLVDDGRVEVVEPGVVREALLRSRLIQDEGLSLPQSDLLRSLLRVDVVLFGEVTDYVEASWGGTVPEVDFSVRAIDTASRQVIWASTSHARGDDGILFFDVGRVPTAYRLASLMARGVTQELLPSLGTP